MNQNNNMSQQTGMVHSLESFGLVDGPGVRFVVFLQGCHMRCQYCHNPETWSMQGGEKWTAEDLFSHVSRYQRYWRDNGGITVSGGEPLLQMDFVRSDIFQGTVEKYIADAAKKLGGSIKFVDAVRFQTGEGIEKKQEDFAAEVAAQMNMGK